MTLTVVCPTCETARPVTRHNEWRIRTGENTGRCVKCANAENARCKSERARASFVSDFWARVDKTGDCWLWTGRLTSHRYGSVGSKGSAHRIAYELTVGPIPEGLTIDHLCRVRHCVNPAHLEPVTMTENVRRGESFSAVNARKTHCPRGHAYDEKNTYRLPSGSRWCRECKRAEGRQYQAARRTLEAGKAKTTFRLPAA